MSLVLVFVAVTGCEDLNTTNPNNPDRQSVLASGSDLISILQGGYVSFWQGAHDTRPGIALGVTADALSVSWGNFGGRRMSEEPRDPYNNRTSEPADYTRVVTDPWFRLLAAVATANDVINAINVDGLTTGTPEQDQMLLASCYFLRGVSHGYLGLFFDQSYIITEETDISQTLDFSNYPDVVEAGVSDLEQAISIASTNDFTMTFFNGVTLDQTQLAQLANSYAARFLAQYPRTPAEEASSSARWSRVSTFAQSGIESNFAPVADGNFWFGYWQFAFAETGQGPFWARLDMRLVAALDPSQPTRFPDTGGVPSPEATSDDERLTSDFIFVATNNFAPNRGQWHFSHYKHNRNVADPTYAGDGASAGPMPAFTVADNALLLAEATLRTGNVAGAADLVNAGTRVTRGGLDPVAADEAAVLRAITYERFIETYNTGPGGHWFDRRRLAERVPFTNLGDLDGLQDGTPAHFPVPAQEQEVREELPYNFGGAAIDPEGTERTF